MLYDKTDWPRVLFIVLFTFLPVASVLGDSLDTDKEVLLNLKLFLEKGNPVNKGHYYEWNRTSTNPCDWTGILCNPNKTRVNGIDLSYNNISQDLFTNFSALSELTHLNLSGNTLSGQIPPDLSRCKNLIYLNLSHNILNGELNLVELKNLATLDLSRNKIGGSIATSFPSICSSLVVLNISENNFSGGIESYFDGCYKLKFLDLGYNNFTGNIWGGFGRLQEFTAANNEFIGGILPSSFPQNCSLRMLDLSGNNFTGSFPGDISNCWNLTVLNLWGNQFTGPVPKEIGSISTLKGLILGTNNFSRDVPDTLLSLSELVFLDFSRNNFRGEVQEIFGKFAQIECLILHSNSYTGGIGTSGILNLSSLMYLDLSYNNFSGPLPVEASRLPKLKYLMLAFNQFDGSIPQEYGDFPQLQFLDLSSNSLSGPIPSTLGRLKSLLWLMLANNSLSGEIPREIGNCSSLLWLNIANNLLSGNIPSELGDIGRNPQPTFARNQERLHVVSGSGECLTLRRWIPADYPPFNFVYDILTRKTCKSIWDHLLKGAGLFQVCAAGTNSRVYQISGYVQMSGNRLSGVLPSSIGNLRNFSMLSLGMNGLYGELPSEIRGMPLVVLNISQNNFSGEIPSEIGEIKCIRTLDLSYNNFSGTFPPSLNNLNELSKFNVSYNPLLSGHIPETGQLATFEKESFLGDPLLVLPPFFNSSKPHETGHGDRHENRPTKLVKFLVFLALTLAFLAFAILTFIVCSLVKSPIDMPGYLLEDTKYRYEFGSSSNCSSPWLSDDVQVVQLVKRAFTYADILKATSHFSDEKIIGKGGFGTVYRGVLPDGREVAVKKLQREGTEGEKEFQSEMEVLSGDSFDWHHPNLVPLYGWCLYGSEKILVYKYMEGGSLEDVITDRIRLTWQKRINIAIDVARALVFLHHECYTSIVHRDVKASNVLLDSCGKAHVTDFGLARVVDVGDSHVSTMVAGTVGYVAPEYGQTWQATTKGDVYSFGVLAMELATGRRAVDGGEECLVEWGRRVVGNGRSGLSRAVIPVALLGSGLADGAEEMYELLRVGISCTSEVPQARPNMKEVLSALFQISSNEKIGSYGSSPSTA